MEDSEGHKYDIYTNWEHLVSTYTRLNMLEVNDLDYVDYLIYKRDAFIYQLNQTEKGREYLDKAYYLEQTKPDRKKLREQFGQKEV